MHEYEAAALQLRRDESFWGEFKWGKLGPRKQAVYEKLLALTFELHDLRFTSMTVDRRLVTRAELDEYHGGEKDLVYLKCFRRLLQHRIRHWAAQGHKEFTLLWDKQAVNPKLSKDFKKFLNYDMDQHEGCSFKHLSPINSPMLHFAQAVDLLTGATHYAWEGPPKGASEKSEASRRALRMQIETWTGESLENDGQWGTRKYSLWRWDPHKGAGAAAGRLAGGPSSRMASPGSS